MGEAVGTLVGEAVGLGVGAPPETNITVSEILEDTAAVSSMMLVPDTESTVEPETIPVLSPFELTELTTTDPTATLAASVLEVAVIVANLYVEETDESSVT